MCKGPKVEVSMAQLFCLENSCLSIKIHIRCDSHQFYQASHAEIFDILLFSQSIKVTVLQPLSTSSEIIILGINFL